MDEPNLNKNYNNSQVGSADIDFAAIVEQSPIPMAVLSGPAHLVTFANSVMLNTFHAAPGIDWQSIPFDEVFSKLRNPKVASLLYDVFTSGLQRSEAEVPLINPKKTYDGTSYFDLICKPWFQPAGLISGVILTAVEVSEKIAACRKGEDAVERAKLAVEIAGISTMDLNLQTHELIHSKSLAVTFGHSATRKLSYPQILDQIEPHDMSNIVDKAFQEAMRTGRYKYEARIIKKPGHFAWIRSYGKIYTDADDEPLRMIGTVIDITAERQRRQILMESEQKFRLLADSLPQHIWTAGSDGVINYYNHSLSLFTGYSNQVLLSEGWQQILHPDDQDAYTTALDNAIATGFDLVAEQRLRNHEGSYRWFRTKAIAQKDADGQVQMWVGTSTDIHDQKSFTDELEKLVSERTADLVERNNTLVKLNIELESFTYVASHDLQEPLRKINIFTDMLCNSENYRFSVDERDYLSKIKISAVRMQTLILDLLAYSRTSISDKNLENIDLKLLAEEVIAGFKEEIKAAKATVDLSSLCEAKIIAFQFRQLFSNLIGNALKFARPNIPPHIIITGKSLTGEELADPELPGKLYCHIRVTDNGIGFDNEYCKKIFEIFQRLHARTEYNGTGIGLAIVKKIVENHQGVIRATGIKGKGAQFDIYLPQ